MKFALVLVLIALAAVNAKDICSDCPIPLDFEEAQRILVAELDIVDSLRGGPKYKSGQIHSATVKDGRMYKINADLTDKDQTVEACDVTLVKKPLESRTEVTIECPNKKKYSEVYYIFAD